ncbi:MAG: Re/Si-specific NAD(P)(+) transhydrogenase subunit alpha [bacterium]|nr:Re/Si-specific NAD(P)(+) transhydrogenase subunit alpha [bacterium]
MNLGIPKEIVEGETRVAIVPESVGKLTGKLGHTVRIESGAGLASGFSDAEYEKEGAEVVKDAASLYSQSDVILKVQRPIDHPGLGKHELDAMKQGAMYIGFFQPLNHPELAQQAAKTGVNVIAMDQVPRITKAQRMDVLSSQTNLAGYKATLIAAESLKKIFPLMMTAAGTISPAKVIILGAGVAGLQAIATAKRLGAVVEVSDVRPAVKEQVLSLGGRYIEPPEEEKTEGEESMEDKGGYAKQASEDFIRRQQEILTEHLKDADAVITTANVPGRKAPLLITDAMLEVMQPGAVIVDMAAESGGNCSVTKANETVVVNGVSVIGVTNLPARVPYHASQLYSRNILSLIEYLTKEAVIELDLEDEIVQGALITNGGEVIHEPTKKLLG